MKMQRAVLTTPLMHGEDSSLAASVKVVAVPCKLNLVSRWSDNPEW